MRREIRRALPTMVAAVLAVLLTVPAEGAPTAPVRAAPAAPATAGVADTSAGFYVPPATLPDDNGAVIRSEPVAVPLPARASRVMYRSTDTDGEPIAVTGTVLVPLVPPPGPLKLVSYAVGTQGVADRCAPSRQFAAGTEYESGFVSALLARGYAVAVTDYEGLGTPGTHTYVIRKAQAHAVLDMARAAQRLDVGVPDDGPVALAGYSQGGGASAAAAELAPDYAPDLDLVGAYSGAVPADLAAVAAFLDGKAAAGLLGYALNGFDAAYPSLDVPGVLNERGRAFLARTREQCVGETAARYPFVRSTDLTRDGRSLSQYLGEEPFRSRVDEQRIGTLTPQVPVLIVHSVADDIVPFDQDRELAQRWCAQGATVAFRPSPVPTHVGAAAPAFAQALAYLGARFADAPAPSTCT